MFPHIERAQDNEWEIMILNPNHNEIAYADGDGNDFGGEGGLSFVRCHEFSFKICRLKRVTYPFRHVLV